MKRLWDKNTKKGDYEEIWSEGENPAYLSDDRKGWRHEKMQTKKLKNTNNQVKAR